MDLIPILIGWIWIAAFLYVGHRYSQHKYKHIIEKRKKVTEKKLNVHEYRMRLLQIICFIGLTLLFLFISLSGYFFSEFDGSSIRIGNTIISIGGENANPDDNLMAFLAFFPIVLMLSYVLFKNTFNQPKIIIIPKSKKD